MSIGWLFAWMFSLAGIAVPQDRPAEFDVAGWKAEIIARRKARDEEFRSREWSALAVTALAAIDRPRLIVGSGTHCELRLDSRDVASSHAELIRDTGNDGKPSVRVRALDGRVVSVGDRPDDVSEAPLAENARIRIGPFLVYWSNFSTFGPVVRALDFSSPAYTRFDGLRYFPPDPRYRVAAEVTAYPRPGRILIGDTQGWQRPAWRYGEAAFSILGRPLKLVLLLWNPEPSAEETFFVAFSDATGGRETYPAARYLTPRFVRSGTLILDFNEATNPLCAYNTGFACPLPPRENRMPVEIRAGEKTYPHAVGGH